MSHPITTYSHLSHVILLVVTSQYTPAATEELGNGFYHHGVATPVSNHRGTVATTDGEGRKVVLVWLFDHRGGYALLLIDADTGKSQEFLMPFPPGGDCPYASILSSKNKFYTHFNSHFVEFDPLTRAFTFYRKTKPQMAMGMTEDDSGVIWSVTYPRSGVVSFDPQTRTLRDYGYVHNENWRQYQRYVAGDDTGWIYFGVGNTRSLVIGFNPETGSGTSMIPEGATGSGYVYRDLDGKVYGHVVGGEWFSFYQGKAAQIGTRDQRRPKPIITSHQGLFHTAFPDGSQLKRCDLVNRKLVIYDKKTNEEKRLSFDYQSQGAHIMGLATSPDGTVCGGTAFPMRFFSYDPHRDVWHNRASYGQWNTVARQGDRFFVGGYGGGFLLQWDPKGEWVATVKGKEGCNPLFLTQCTPAIHRPHDLLAHPDGTTLILAGTPGYGYTGGGLLFWDRSSKRPILVEHTDLLPEHSTQSLAALPDGKILGGSTTSAGTGGEKKAREAELYILDLATKKIEWHAAVFRGVQGYTDLCPGPGSLAFGFADRSRFFVFDSRTRRVLHMEDTARTFGPTVSQQGPRVFVRCPDGAIYLLFVKGIALLDSATYSIKLLARSPVSIGSGGDYCNGRIYFGSGSHLYSYEVPQI